MNWDKEQKRFRVERKTRQTFETEDMLLIPKEPSGVPDWIKKIVAQHNFVNGLSPELRNLWEWLKEYEQNPY